MIQRWQTVFLLIAVVLGLVHWMAWPLGVVQLLASAVSLYAIFLYKRRPLQATLCLVSIVVNLAWYVALGIMMNRGVVGQPLPLTACLPMVADILCFLARRRVVADERLVRAADRIR